MPDSGTGFGGIRGQGKLAPGMRLPREVVRGSQRERLLLAVLELVDRDGCSTLTVAALTKRAHVSRAAFYELFDTIDDCFLTAYQAQANRLAAVLISSYNAPGLSESQRVDKARQAFVHAVETSPGIARVCVADVLTAGPLAERPREQLVDYARQALKSANGDGDGRPSAVPLCRATALVGGVRRALYDHLRDPGEDGLDGLTETLLDWFAGCRDAPALATDAANPRSISPEKPPRRTDAEPPSTADDARQRIVEAVIRLAAKRGYRELNHREIAHEARVSYNTFYKHFPNKQEAFLCACREAYERVVAPAEETLAAAKSWPKGFCAALDVYLEELVRDPGCTRAGAIEVLALGRAGLAQLDDCALTVEQLIRPGLERKPGVRPPVIKALAGAIEETVRHYAAKRILHRLPDTHAELSRIVLTPFLGPRKASQLATQAP